MKNSEKHVFATASQRGNEMFIQRGLTKREYFAGLAMQTMCREIYHGPSDFVNFETENISKITESIAKMSISMADALINELEQQENK